ncbi:MAG: alpha/beta hydrolase [Actinomycetales bacterium]|nr:alpha/beta hydrolase [Actinomycetales bacterium]
MSAANCRPPFDPEIEAALTSMGDEVVQGLTADQIPELRRRLPPADLAPLAGDDRFELSEHLVAHVGAEVTMVLARPVAVPAPVPVLYHLHGGGLVAGSAYEDLPPLLELAAATGTAVAALEYRLAPEWPFPAAVDDAHAGLVWLAQRGAGLGLDTGRVVVTGVSAGGGLAAATALVARDRGGPALAGQMLVYPMLDDRNNLPSAVQMAGAGTWDRTANATAWRAYLGEQVGGPGVPAHAAPAREPDLSGLPPAFIDVGSAETFRDEDVAYAARLWRHGGEAELHVWPGGCHGFDLLAPEAAVSREARAARVRWLLRLLARPAST